MRYTVRWVRSAEEDLAAIWMQSEDRAVVASAADTLDTLLRDDAHLQGESRAGSLRIMFVPPLGIDFEVIGDDRIVRVLAVWTIR